MDPVQYLSEPHRDAITLDSFHHNASTAFTGLSSKLTDALDSRALTSLIVVVGIAVVLCMIVWRNVGSLYGRSIVAVGLAMFSTMCIHGMLAKLVRSLLALEGDGRVLIREFKSVVKSDYDRCGFRASLLDR